MLAIDLVSFALVVGVAVLCVTTALSSLALPSVNSWRRKRRRRRAPLQLPVAQRRVVTGPPATGRPPAPLPAAARQNAYSPDTFFRTPQLREAEVLVEHMLEHDPRRLAELITNWINSDQPSGARRYDRPHR